jgi:N-acetylglucosaminyldiphosphoundecaprenol N-acetyl-beta-D-mannosaminyltransferase
MATEVLVSTGSPSLQSRVAVSSEITRMHRRRVEVGGVALHQVDLCGALEMVEGFVASGMPHQVVTVNLDFVSIASRDAAFRSLLNAADLAVADGMPLVWLSRLKGAPLQERIAGVELVTESCRMAAEMGRSVFLLGAAPGVAETAARRLEGLFPGLCVAGTYSPPVGKLSQEEDQHIVDMIREAAPDFLFVALGAPRQDLWIRDHQPKLRVPVAMGVGCVFDLLAGNVRRAPLWMQQRGLEWAFRLGQEPHRLWRRYLMNDLPMLARLTFSGMPAEADVVAA